MIKVRMIKTNENGGVIYYILHNGQSYRFCDYMDAKAMIDDIMEGKHKTDTTYMVNELGVCNPNITMPDRIRYTCVDLRKNR